jgi:hypothetical protein
MNSSQHDADLLNLPLLLSGLDVMSLKNALVLRLNDEYTDSMRLLSPKGFDIILQAESLKGFRQPRRTVDCKLGLSIAVF